MRYRAEYLHVPTSSRILFTVAVPENDGDPASSAGQAIARRRATEWVEKTGLATDCVFLSVAAVTDKMSVAR